MTVLSPQTISHTTKLVYIKLEDIVSPILETYYRFAVDTLCGSKFGIHHVSHCSILIKLLKQDHNNCDWHIRLFPKS